MARASIGGLAVALALVAGAARAQAAPDALARAVRPEAPTVRLSLRGQDVDALALRRAGVARTAVDLRLSGDNLTSVVGFQCGLQPSAIRDGAAAARGVDPSGRFVGAKLRLAFR